MNIQHAKFVEDVRSVLAYHHAIGVAWYPRDAGVSHFGGGKAGTEACVERVAPEQQTLPVVSETLADIVAEIKACRSCELHEKRVVPVPGRGGAKARLLIVGGWLTCPDSTALPQGTVFGLEEDRMLARMMEAIHLAPDDVLVTNILKCGLPGSCQPVAAQLQCCLPYLRRQIAVTAPELICAMGTVPTRALLDLPQSLSQLRGRFHLYTDLDGRQIPLIPTYHPSYLLQAEEMKKETWKDLQLIEKRLAE